MLPPPTYGSAAIRHLVERTEYEAWLLEAVYVIAEQELFPKSPDAVVYPVDQSRAKYYLHARANIASSDWRLDFLNIGAPLVFVTTFKLLDMFVEWVLGENGVPPTHGFREKLKHLNRSVLYPPLIETRPWLKDRIAGLYGTLIPLRGTIIHDRHFTVSGGAVRVSRSKAKAVVAPVEIGGAQLRILALTLVSILRYVDGTWLFDRYREKVLRYHLDGLASLHGLASLGQLRPFSPTVRVYTSDKDLRSVDLAAIRIDLAAHYPNRDYMFDLRVLNVKDGAVVDAFLLPWALLENSGPGWRSEINSETYRVPIPNDIEEQHLRGHDAS